MARVLVTVAVQGADPGIEQDVRPDGAACLNMLQSPAAGLRSEAALPSGGFLLPASGFVLRLTTAVLDVAGSEMQAHSKLLRRTLVWRADQ